MSFIDSYVSMTAAASYIYIYTHTHTHTHIHTYIHTHIYTHNTKNNRNSNTLYMNYLDYNERNYKAIYVKCR